MPNLISNDPLVSAIFETVANHPAVARDPKNERIEKLRAITRAAKIAEAYLNENVTPEAIRVSAATLSPLEL